MAVSFEKIGDVTASFNGTASKGDIVSMYASDAIIKASSGNRIVGLCTSSENTTCAVQVRGFVTFGYTGTAPVVGTNSITAAGSNKIKIASTGDSAISVLCVSVDTEANTATILL